MSALQQAVARAIADAPTCDDLGCEAHMDCPGTCRSAIAEADAVIGVVLIEAQRAIRAMPWDADTSCIDALAALAELAGEEP